ncbi:mediator of RNA polymerase II transcription subunit 19-like isoform X1 [Argiope bruennichi]|uniref:mediator of RNA polymerase II transcription subunit 19-like isoform X1 n=1 Tax=Argiope bruennichi TaxID=94029 RepID=UPI002493E864|nr:mediator of RNA polymerase II transcription subunit 19-like isoform X1 [Argiope bruennichi]
MADVGRKPESYSPKSSPRGSRSPVVPRQDSTGTLKTTISLGKTPAIVHSGPFYLMKEPPKSELTGASNLMSFYNLEHSYNKFCGRKMKDQLSAFLPNLPGNIDGPGSLDNSSLKSLIEKPPIGGKELLPLTGSQLSGFRLHPGPLPEQYRLMSQQPQKKKHKHKKHKHKAGDTPTQESQQDINIDGPHEKKHKKQKRHDEEKEKKKKKKEKKKKKRYCKRDEFDIWYCIFLYYYKKFIITSIIVCYQENFKENYYLKAIDAFLQE